MTITLSRTKIPTPRARILKRVRLLDQLHENVHRRLTFICAPAGYGKTTLLQSFAADVEMSVCWYQIGPDETHLSAFLDNLIQAIDNCYSGFRDSFPGFKPGQHNLSPSVAAAHLINATVERIADYTLLILDDYHLVSQHPSISQFVEALLAALPDHLRLVISSRSVYGIPTAHLFVQQEIAVLVAEDLKFRPQEIRDLSRLSFHRALSEDELAEINRTTDGWAMAAMLALQDQVAPAQPLRLLSAQEQVFDYFNEELIGQLDEGLVRFLLATALVEEFSLELASYLLGEGEVEQSVRELFDRNLFITLREDNDQEVYSYHQLFREFLLQQHARLEPGLLNHYRSRLAEWFEQNDAPAAAIQHRLAAGMLLEAANLINRSAKWAYASGRQDLLDDWYLNLEGQSELLRLMPDLLLNRAKSLINKGDYEQAMLLMNAAEPEFTDKEDHENLCNLLVTRGMLHRFTGQYQAGLDCALRAKKLAAEHSVDVYYGLQAGRLEGITQYYLGEADVALAHLNRAAEGLRNLLQVRASDRIVHELIATLTDIGYICITSGRLVEAERSYLEALDLSTRVWANRGDQAVCGNNAAYLRYILGDYQQAWVWYEQALQAARNSEWRAILADVLNGQGDLLRDLGELDLAVEKYGEVLELANADPAGIALTDTHLGLAEVERRHGAYAQAQWHVREAGRLGKLPPDALDLRLQNAVIYLAMGHPELALETLEVEGNSEPNAARPTQRLAQAYFYLAIAQLRMGQPSEQAMANLGRALEIAARLGYDSFLVSLLREFGQELESAGEDEKSPQLQSLLTRSREPLLVEDILGEPKTSEIETVAARIEVIGMGRAEVRLNGERLTAADWQSLGARSLFFYVLEQQPAQKEQIAATFWPDFSPGKVNSNFHATLWRVRNALGNRQVIHFDDQGYRLHPELSIYYDVAEFEQTFRQMQGLDKNTAEWRELADRAVNLYSGDFLPEIDMAWAQDRSRELRQKLLVALTELAEVQRLARRPSLALDLYSRAVVIDPYEDQWRLGVLRSFMDMNQRQTARNYYRSYQQLLADDLGVEPTEELVTFSQSFI